MVMSLTCVALLELFPWRGNSAMDAVSQVLTQPRGGSVRVVSAAGLDGATEAPSVFQWMLH